MELKLIEHIKEKYKDLVLIVPFMELKLAAATGPSHTFICLNRTFYGIETCLTLTATS